MPTLVSIHKLKINPYFSITYGENGNLIPIQVANLDLSFAELTKNRHVSDAKGLRVSMALKLELLVEYHAFHGF